MGTARSRANEIAEKARLRAQELAAREKVLEKKADLAARAELDKARDMAKYAEKWMKNRAAADGKKLLALEKRLEKQLRDAEKKAMAKARAAEKKAEAKAREAAKKLEARARAGAAIVKGRSTTASKRKARPAAKKRAAKKK
jgi:histone H1/5